MYIYLYIRVYFCLINSFNYTPVVLVLKMIISWCRWGFSQLLWKPSTTFVMLQKSFCFLLSGVAFEVGIPRTCTNITRYSLSLMLLPHYESETMQAHRYELNRCTTPHLHNHTYMCMYMFTLKHILTTMPTHSYECI